MLPNAERRTIRAACYVLRNAEGRDGLATIGNRRSAVMTDVTRILNALEQGDAKAADQLLPLVYEELRLLAARKLSREPPGQTLEATVLVHEAYIRLVGDEPVS